jgi:glycogen synthase
MKVLMFGWEFPPHISGGLGTASYGIVHALLQEETDIVFVTPRLFGDERKEKMELISASTIPIIENITIEEPSLSQKTEWGNSSQKLLQLTKIDIPSLLDPYQSTEIISSAIQQWNYRFRVLQEMHHINRKTEGRKSLYSFKGGYGADLIHEVYKYADAAITLASSKEFDVIHAHDWMTFPAAITAKKISGKPLIIHVHATEYDRAPNGGNEIVFQIEKQGMEEADRVVAVSQWTKELIIDKYGIPEEIIKVVHNGVLMNKDFNPISSPSPIGSHIITFLGRITHQKGPRYFVDAAKKVLTKFPEAHFVMAGSGDLFPQIVERVAQLKLSSRFHFTGFLNKNEIDQILSISNVYVMPSVSEPFGITPLEAVHAGVPVIISNQSGVAEVMQHALKVNFWDSQALAEAICSVLHYKSLSQALIENGGKEIKEITWNKTARKLKAIYHELSN